jgi:hypothetical protein
MGRFGSSEASSGSEVVDARKENHVGEDREKTKPEPEIQQRDEGEDVEAHGFKPGVKPAAEAAATEEGPDVEAHGFKPKAKP